MVVSSHTALHSCHNLTFVRNTRTLEDSTSLPHKVAAREPSPDFLSGGKIKFRLRPALRLGSYCTDLVCELKSLAEGRACLQLPGTGAIRMPARGPESLPPTLHPGPQPAQVRWAPGLGPLEMPPTPA